MAASTATPTTSRSRTWPWDSPVTTSKHDTWVVEATDAQITVPAGTFTCLQLRNLNTVTGSDNRYWFAQGVGKIREEGATQVEELTSYSLPWQPRRFETSAAQSP